MDDDALVRCLGRTLTRTDPAPEWLRDAACELFAWRTIDADLTELLRATPAVAE
jgi:HAMP domain-containing protein